MDVDTKSVCNFKLMFQICIAPSALTVFYDNLFLDSPLSFLIPNAKNVDNTDGDPIK